MNTSAEATSRQQSNETRPSDLGLVSLTVSLLSAVRLDLVVRLPCPVSVQPDPGRAVGATAQPTQLQTYLRQFRQHVGHGDGGVRAGQLPRAGSAPCSATGRTLTPSITSLTLSRWCRRRLAGQLLSNVGRRRPAHQLMVTEAPSTAPAGLTFREGTGHIVVSPSTKRVVGAVGLPASALAPQQAPRCQRTRPCRCRGPGAGAHPELRSVRERVGVQVRRWRTRAARSSAGPPTGRSDRPHQRQSTGAAGSTSAHPGRRERD